MFYHSFPLQDPSPSEWFAWHAETLTPIHISLTGHVATCLLRPASHHLAPDTTVTAPADFGAIASSLLEELRSRFSPDFSTTITKLPAPFPDLPEYLLAFAADGTRPVIIRTQDPVFIAAATDDWKLSTDIPHFASTVRLPAEGWAYWWEDAARALDHFAETHRKTL